MSVTEQGAGQGGERRTEQGAERRAEQGGEAHQPLSNPRRKRAAGLQVAPLAEQQVEQQLEQQAAERTGAETSAAREPAKARRRLPSNPRVVHGALVKPATSRTDASSAHATADPTLVATADVRGSSADVGRPAAARATRRSPAARPLDARGESGARDQSAGRPLDGSLAGAAAPSRRAKPKRQPRPLPHVPTASDPARGATAGAVHSLANAPRSTHESTHENAKEAARRIASPRPSDAETDDGAMPTSLAVPATDGRDPAATEALALLLDCYQVGDVLQIARLVATINADLDKLERSGAVTGLAAVAIAAASGGAARPTTDGAADDSAAATPTGAAR
jgi:hypothetical protein